MRFSAINIHLLSVACAMTMLCSCEYKDLDEIEVMPNTVLLDFSWEKVDSIPQCFRVVFYPADEETCQKIIQGYMVFDVYNRQCVLRDLPAGRYKVTAWNTDTEFNQIENLGNRSSLMATTPPVYNTSDIPASVIDSLYAGQAVYTTPDYMVHANEDLVTVEFNKQSQPLTLHPDSMVAEVEYRIRHVAGLNMAKQVKGTIDNVAKKRFVAYGNATKENAIAMFDCNYNEKDSLVFGRFYLYGIEPTDIKASKHTLTLFFWLEGKNIFVQTDVTEALSAFNKDDNKLLVEIDNLDIDLKEYLDNGTGFDINVGEWKDENIDIPW